MRLPDPASPRSPRHPRAALHAVIGLMTLSTTVVSCSKKLNKEECGHLLGHGVGLVAYPSAEVVPVDVDKLHARAKGNVKDALASFDQACIGANDDDQILCGRRAKNMQEFVACGPLTKMAVQTGEFAQLAIPKRHNADECAKYGDHGVKIGAAAIDDAGKLVQECDRWMEVGTYRCRLASKDVAAWKACE